MIKKIRKLQSYIQQIEVDISDYREKIAGCKRNYNEKFFKSGLKNLKIKRRILIQTLDSLTMADKGMLVISLKNKENGKEYIDYLFRERSEDAYDYFKNKVYVEGLTEDLRDSHLSDWQQEVILDKTTSIQTAQDIVELHIQARETLIPEGYNKDLGVKLL